ncbi:MAG: tol-pal system protein YbgF [Albidovulum sp.]
MIRAMIRVLTLAVALSAASGAVAQERSETLADIRTELGALAAQLQGLKNELLAGGAEALQAAGGASALDRMNAIEAELSRITAQTEQLQLRVEGVVADGTNRIGDLEFRLCELEEGCDLSNLSISAGLGSSAGGATGGGSIAAPVTDGGAAATPTAELAINEQADFDAAKAALDGGDFAGAAEKFANFAVAYPGGPLTGDAQFLQGEALSQAGDTAGAARAFLGAFSGDPTGARAPASLLRLGAALGLLGQTQDACVTLGQVGARFPQAPEAVEAGVVMQKLSCQ